MKIGIDIRTLMNARPSGVSEYTYRLIKEILRLDNYNEYRFFYNSFGNCPNIPKFTKNNVKLVKYNYPNKVLNYLYFEFFNSPKIDKELETDVFFMPHLNFIGLSKGAKSLITVHDLSFLRYPEFFSWRKNFWHRMINVKKLVKRFSTIVAVSENTKRDIVELCGIDENKVKVIYAGVGEEYRRMADDQSLKMAKVREKYKLPDKFILYLGTVEPRKNVEGIIRAYNEVRSKKLELRNINLVIAGGKGWKSKKIYREREESKFKDDIKFLGYIDPEDKVYLYNLASVFVYPSFYEGFGFPPLEAMACGLPVVASFASSLPEVVGDAALMVDPYNINDISRALKEILTNENLRNQLIARGLKRAGEFSWRKTADEYLKVLKNL
ncbi:MAG: Glycosyl transferase group 1 [Candidatus Falkowbacteria bacterium GW2011_GWA2_41_14]|uniref:Glycosyl transferase group 1 n=1 Tax=Candidatus Falkowbacteria bacterium GW2011_GWA2_41_14 TaxID=1618635 RepID=A0A0G0UUW5_9BACT|nr:MAG: Glycosyl transferase group 1 [Candidatus Falkowbacteria bacterium GW2011_GWA2_41_14]